MRQLPFKKLLIGELSWKRLVRSLLLIYIFFALYVFFRADSMIFLPQPASYQNTGDILKLPVTPTERISAIYLPNSQAAYTLLYIHGNAEDLGDIRPVLERLYSWGFSVFAYDYRGYGTSDGNPSEHHAYQDADAAYTYLIQQLKIPLEKIIVYGRSVGGGSATDLASRHSVAGLILESTFTSAFRVVVPFPLLPFDKFSNLDKLRKIRCPVLVMHGEADQTIPIQHSQTLYEAAPEPKMSLWVAEAGHNDFTWVAGKRYQQVLLSFQKLVEAHPQK
ncbi:alpha/beta hydrolase [Leptolyngbya sp. FACHB-36]|uniref:alpha/beta hydrolase n=1 Tax=Leptolyngbya sp. FACHB-36 TaxID=2692808 RepID=UPI001681BEBF|nr:alpha/beta hydrolase [Leptolyngbya sp. FACHB-36]MBD2019907.1 alpha/beta hydrolase [Leptolyngbya sp. FACHB-36]